jgi:hypothetical protein
MLRDKLINYASKWIGYCEKKSEQYLDDFKKNAGSGNFTCFARDYKKYSGIDVQGQPWCDVFVDMCFINVFGVEIAKDLLHGFSAYTPTSADNFKKYNEWFKTPQVGDVIFFKNSNRICHTGIVYNVTKDRVYTIEGNTSGGTTLEANGGCVAKKNYTLSYNRIAGYGRPNYKKYEPKEVVVEEYTDNEHIIWELHNRKIIADVNLWRSKLSEDTNIYWLCRKAIHYIRTKNTTEYADKAYTEIEHILWELQNRKIITDVTLWRSKMNEDSNIYWLCQKIIHYVRTQKKEV